MTLGDVIHRYREENSLSMEQFAKKSGLSKAYVALLEKNEHPKTKQPITPSIITFGCVANALGITLDELLGAVDENQPVYIVKAPDPQQKIHGLKPRIKPFHSDKGTRLNCKIDSELYDMLATLADANDRTLEDEIENRLFASVEEEIEYRKQQNGQGE